MDAAPTRSPAGSPTQTRTDSAKPKYRSDADASPAAAPAPISAAQATLRQYEAYAALAPAVIDSNAPPRVQSSPVAGAAAAESSLSSEAQLARDMRSTLARRSVAKIAASNDPAAAAAASSAAPPSSWNASAAPLIESLATAPTSAAAASAAPRSPVAGGYVSLASALPLSVVPATEAAPTLPAPQPAERSLASASQLSPVVSSRDALQAEISRLQLELQATRSSQGPPTQWIAQPRVRSSPGAGRSSQAAGSPAPLTLSASQLCASPRASSARDRLRERELSLRASISARAHLYCLMILRALLVQLSLTKGSTLLAAAMSLPHVRDALCFACDVLVAAAEWVLYSSLFGLLPGSSFVRGVLSDPVLEAEWMALPEWPQPRVLPWTAGPLRPLFAVASYLPFASRVFEMAPVDGDDQIEGEEGVASASEGSEQREPVEDGPLASSLKRAGGMEPIVARRVAPIRSIAASAAPASVALHASIASAPPASSARSSLLARVDAQQSLIALLQHDRADMHASLRRLEAQVRLMQQQQQLQLGSPSASPLSPSASGLGGVIEGDADFPLGSLASFIGVAASQRLASLQEENVQLRGLSLAQQAQAELQEREIHDLRTEFEALRQDMKQEQTQQQQQIGEASMQPAEPETDAVESQQTPASSP